MREANPVSVSGLHILQLPFSHSLVIACLLLTPFLMLYQGFYGGLLFPEGYLIRFCPKTEWKPVDTHNSLVLIQMISELTV